MNEHPLVKALALWSDSLFVRLNVILATVGFLYLLWS